uniref:Serine carboxypeptidase n=1 Tax=Ditylenchus dipsaci TaxID=166011 RepID=A0A915ENZ7_9BILA
MAIGNGYVDEKLNIDTSIRFAYGHGIIDEKVWNTLEIECCRGCIDGCDLTQLSGHCARMVEDTFEFLWHGGLNPYDLYRDCDPTRTLTAIRFTARLNSTTQSRRQMPMSDQQYLGGESVPCLNDSDLTTYMNNPQVRQALHIPDNLPAWAICSADVGQVYGKVYGDMSPFIKKILNAHVRVLLYYGDTDMACNFMMGQQFSARLGLKRVLNKQPWKFDKQIAGFKTIYGKGLTFLTVRGAGHMAPQWKAPQMDYVMQQFLINHPI